MEQEKLQGAGEKEQMTPEEIKERFRLLSEPDPLTKEQEKIFLAIEKQMITEEWDSLEKFVVRNRFITIYNGFVSPPTDKSQEEYIPYQLCPKCNGEGQCDNIGTSSSMYRVCPVCNGSKIIPMCKINQ